MRRLLAFLRGTRAGAAGIAAAAVTVMGVGGAALIGDHVWLVDQRDVLKTAADAAAVAATLEMKDLPQNLGAAALRTRLHPVAERYVRLNLTHLPKERYDEAIRTLVVEVFPNRSAGTVQVTAEANLGGTLFASRLPLFAGYTDPATTEVEAGVECATNLVEVVLAFDVTASMHDRVGGQRKIEATVAAAEALLDVLYAGCGGRQRRARGRPLGQDGAPRPGDPPALPAQELGGPEVLPPRSGTRQPGLGGVPGGSRPHGRRRAHLGWALARAPRPAGAGVPRFLQPEHDYPGSVGGRTGARCGAGALFPTLTRATSPGRFAGGATTTGASRSR